MKTSSQSNTLLNEHILLPSLIFLPQSKLQTRQYSVLCYQKTVLHFETHMENKEKIKIAFTVVCLATISLLLTTKYRKHRKQKQQSSTSSSCYLKTEQKPQQSFKRVFADNSYSPFKHLKLNGSNGEKSSSLNPYKSEIAALLKNPQLEFEFIVDVNVLEMNDSYVWIETESELKDLAEVLSRESVFAVDTEQHSLRSFLGFTALIQISTQTKDYLVDTIALHDVMPILRPVFANPDICKVFHGADNDILWLQRDFLIYVINLFDTAKACEVLSKPQKSLAYLLETYCNVATNKLLQREDWRQRPLPVEMVQYARIDAHYLLYIASRLVFELKELDAGVSENSACLDDKFHILDASRRSNAMCLQLFAKEIEAFPGESAASSIINRHLNDKGSSSSITSRVQDFVRQLCAWRDLMARIHDESLKYVLPDHAIIALARDTPATETDIYDSILQADTSADSLNLSPSNHSPSAVVCSHIEDLTYFFNNEMGNLDDSFHLILKEHLGPNGSCPLSIYNYTLLSKNNLKLTNKLVSKGTGFSHSKHVARKASRELFVQKFSCKSPVYHNCRIYANDGRLLCYCDRRKLEWYLRRDLAKLVDDNPLAIMLLFEPKGRPEDEDNDFYIQSKKNICVGCGEGNHYLRYRVIPSCYRMHFPEHLKSHRSHDIVLLCVDCHEIAHSAAEKYKSKVATEFGIPLFIRKVVDSSQAQDKSRISSPALHLEDAGVSPLELRTAAMALLRHGPRMPSKRREELTQIVMKYYGGREISDEDLERALLVGMSPHERRRAEKKRGLSLKLVTASIGQNKEPENNGNGPYSAPEYTSSTNDVDGSHGISIELGCNGGETMPPIVDVSRNPVSSKHEVCEETSITDRIYLNTCSKNSDNTKNWETNSDSTRATVLDSGTSLEFNGPLNGVAPPKSSSDTESKGVPLLYSDTSSECNGPLSETVSSKSTSKLSLLGHGPHGKQVVDHLLKKYGDDGIREFCQRWRQVFVDAIRPRFLPAGWDVAHSGKRDFGEFSVYNPAKKGSAVTNYS